MYSRVQKLPRFRGGSYTGPGSVRPLGQLLDCLAVENQLRPLRPVSLASGWYLEEYHTSALTLLPVGFRHDIGQAYPHQVSLTMQKISFPATSLLVYYTYRYRQ